MDYLGEFVVTPRRSQVRGFRTDWHPVEYACREPNGSLKPLWPGQTRLELYCSKCKAARCLLLPSYGVALGGPPPKRVVIRSEESRKERRKKQRSRGKDTQGKPMKRSCWNCHGVRCKTRARYVCGLDPKAAPVSVQWLSGAAGQDRAAACEYFSWRTAAEVKPLPADEAGLKSAQNNIRHVKTLRVNRARGLGTDGRPLKSVCWNCDKVRCLNGGFVCPFAPEELLTAGQLRHRPACGEFGLRLVVEISPLSITGGGQRCV